MLTVWFQRWPKEKTDNFCRKEKLYDQVLVYRRIRLFSQVIAPGKEAAGLTQTELAGRLNKPQSYIYKNESGERRVDVTEYLDIMYALGKDPHEILDELCKMYK